VGQFELLSSFVTIEKIQTIPLPCSTAGKRLRGAWYTLQFGTNKRSVSVPLYEYKCLKCGRKTEKIENVNGPHLKKCPHCGGKVEALFSAPAIQFKGSGWYVTDYGGKKSSGDSGKEDKAAAESKDAKEATKDSASKDSGSTDSGAKESAKDSGSKEKKTEKSGKKK
jgi:putative FmdB family regulatory protein